MSDLLKRLAKNSVVNREILQNSRFFTDQLVIPTRVPLLNLALSGKFDGGFSSGIVQIAAPPKHFKSNLMIEFIASFLEKYKDEDALVVMYDSEGGTTPEYFASAGIDISKIDHRPISSIEELTSDIANLCEDIVLGDKVLICIDSIGMLPSMKSIKDAKTENHVVDMSAAKNLKAMFKIIMSQSVVKKIPIVVINHSYQTLELYSKEVAAGGRASQYAASTLFHITKAEDKDGDEKLGFRFTLIAGLSRFVKQSSKFPIVVHYNHGIRKYSGIFDLAIEHGFVESPAQGWYWKDEAQTVKVRRKALERDEEFMIGLLNNKKFTDAVEKHYSLSATDEKPVDTDDEEHQDVKEYSLKKKK